MANEIVNAFARAWRDYETDGVAASGDHKVVLSEARTAGSVVQDQVDAVAAAMSGFTSDVDTLSDKVDVLAAGQGKGSIAAATLAALTTLASTLGLNNTTDRGRIGSVYSDSTAANNGDYSWSGTAWTYLGSGRIGKVEAAVGSPLVIFGDNYPIVWDYDGHLGTAQAVYVPRRIYARIGSTTINGSFGTAASELSGYVKFALGDTDHSAIYIDLADGTNPVKFTNYPTEPTTLRVDQVRVIAEIFGRNFKSDLPWVALTDAARDRVHFLRPLAVEGTKLLVPAFYHRRAGQSAVLYQPSDGSHFWQVNISTDLTIYNHLIDIRAAQAGSNPVVTVAGSGGPTFADDYLYVEFATSENGGVASPHEIRGNVPGGSVPNQFRRGRRPDLCRLYNDTSGRSATVVDITDTTLLGMGFTKAVTGNGAFFGGAFEELPPKKGYIFFRMVIKRASDGTWPAAPYLYLRSGDNILQTYGGAIEQQVSADIRIQYTYASYSFDQEPVWWWMGGFQPTGTADAQFTGAQLYVGSDPRGWILRDDWPDLLDDRLIIGPDLWTITGRPLPIYLSSISGSRWAGGADPVLSVSSYDATHAGCPAIYEESESVLLQPASLFSTVNVAVMDRTDREQRAVAAMTAHKAPATATGAKKILCMGDSTTRYSVAAFVKAKLQAMGMTITALGTLLDEDGAPTEGRSGWTWADWSRDDPTYPLPSSPATYLSYAQTGTGAGTRHSYNPWINPSSGNFDPGYFLSTYSVATPDYITLGLGTNDERVSAITLAALKSRISTAFDKIVPALLSALPSVRIGLWMPSRPFARDSDQLWQTFRRETINQIIAKRDALASGKTRVDIVPVWAHMSAVSGWHLIDTPTPAGGPKLTAVDDSLHQYDVNREMVAEALAAWIACKNAGV